MGLSLQAKNHVGTNPLLVAGNSPNIRAGQQPGHDCAEPIRSHQATVENDQVYAPFLEVLDRGLIRERLDAFSEIQIRLREKTAVAVQDRLLVLCAPEHIETVGHDVEPIGGGDRQFQHYRSRLIGQPAVDLRRRRHDEPRP